MDNHVDVLAKEWKLHPYTFPPREVNHGTPEEPRILWHYEAVIGTEDATIVATVSGSRTMYDEEQPKGWPKLRYEDVFKVAAAIKAVPKMLAALKALEPHLDSLDVETQYLVIDALECASQSEALMKEVNEIER